jgi:hypothetical protein
MMLLHIGATDGVLEEDLDQPRQGKGIHASRAIWKTSTGTTV